MNKREEVQQQALDVAVRNKRCSLAISMGVGKTLIGLRYIEHFQDLSAGKLNILVVAPKLSIFDSWKTDSQKFHISLNNVTFTTYLSINKHNPSDYDMVILDECHSLLPSHRAFLSMFNGRILGLTGTPPRYTKSDKGRMVQDFCPVLYQYITDDAVEDEILNDYRIIVHMMPLSEANNLLVKTKKNQFFTSERRNYQYWTNRILQANSKKEEQISSVMRMRALMDFKTKENYAQELLSEIQDKCIVFCNTQEQADRMCTYSYHSTNEAAEDNLEMFKSGKIDKLSCVLQLNEGVNIPNLKAGIILHSYGNERKSSQRIGRLLRLNPDETAIVHILCYSDSVDERWVAEALRDLDPTKITYHHIQQADESTLYR